MGDCLFMGGLLSLIDRSGGGAYNKDKSGGED